MKLNIKNNYDQLPLQIKATLWLTVANVIYSAIKFLVTPILTRTLPETQYGMVGIYNSWNNIAVVIIGLSLTKGMYFTGLSEFKKERNEFTSSLLILSIFITFTWFFIYWPFRTAINIFLGLDTILILTIFAYLLCYPGLEFWQACKRFDFSYKSLACITVLSIFLSQLLGVAGIFLAKTTIEKYKIYLLLSNSVLIFIGIIFSIYILFKGKFAVKIKYWKYGLSFNIPLVPYYLSSFILAQLDRIILLHLRNSEEVGNYVFGGTCANLVQVMNSAVNPTFSSYFLQNIKQNKLEKIRKAAIASLLVYALLSLSMLAFLKEILLILGGPKYSHVYMVMPALLLGEFFHVSGLLFSISCFYTHKTKYLTFMTATTAVINLVLNLIFIPKYGFIAAGYTTMFSYFLFAILNLIFSYKLLEKNNPFTFKCFLSITFFLIMLSSLFIVLYKYFFIRFFIVFMSICILLIRKKWLISKFRL